MIQDMMLDSKDGTSAQEGEPIGPAHYSDEDILRASHDQPELFGVLVDRYEVAFLRKALAILYSKEDAEEVVQDTFTRIYVYANRYNPQEGAQFSSWAYSILTRLCFTRYAKLKKGRERNLQLDPETFERLADSEVFLEELTSRDEVLVALSTLPESFARVLKLQFLEGKSQEEIAVSEGSSISAVKTRVHRAKKLFKESFTYGKN
ncbi:MAG: RNA polymerase sigma factor [Candidatus Paceibacterota bacterium]